MEEKNNLKEQVQEEQDEINKRINALYGESNYSRTPRKEMAEEEKTKIRKQMFFLVCFCVIMGALIILNIIHPITNIFEKKQPVIEEKESTEELPSGDVDINNNEIQTINKFFQFNVKNPLYEENIMRLFDKTMSLEEMDFQIKMFLLTSNISFNELMFKNTNLKNYNPKSEENMTITFTKEQLSSWASEVFGKNVVLEYQNFKYYYNLGEDEYVYFEAILENDNYVLKNIPASPAPTNLVLLNLESASNLDNEVYLRSNVLYVNDKCIHGDKNMKICLGTDTNKMYDYFLQGSACEFLFKRNNGGNKISYSFEKLIVINVQYGEAIQ